VQRHGFNVLASSWASANMGAPERTFTEATMNEQVPLPPAYEPCPLSPGPYLICPDCGALVTEDTATRHEDFHARLAADLRMAGRYRSALAATNGRKESAG
jgi:hypothetical protein